VKYFVILLVLIGFILPQAFANENLFYGTSSFERLPSFLVPENTEIVEIKFQYTDGPYSLSVKPIIDISPKGASSYVHAEFPLLEGVVKNSIKRMVGTITVDPEIPSEKIFLNISYNGTYGVEPPVNFKSGWIDSLILDISQKVTITKVPSSQDYEFDTMTGARCNGEPSFCHGTFANGTTIPIQCDYRHSCGAIPFDASVYKVFQLSPLKQFKSGIPFSEIKCNGNLQLTQRYDGTPACIKDGTVFELIKRGWTSEIIRLVQSRDVFLDPKDATSSHMDRITPTLEDFKNTLSEPYDIDMIFSKFGEPHRDIGSGIHIYVYELNDLTEIWVGYADDIWYVKHVDANGNTLEDLFVKNEN